MSQNLKQNKSFAYVLLDLLQTFYDRTDNTKLDSKLQSYYTKVTNSNSLVQNYYEEIIKELETFELDYFRNIDNYVKTCFNQSYNIIICQCLISITKLNANKAERPRDEVEQCIIKLSGEFCYDDSEDKTPSPLTIQVVCNKLVRYISI